MSRVRKVSDIIQQMIEKYENNPIIESVEIQPTHITTKEHISELHDILVQTCIDYINKHQLTDIYSVSFNADALAESAKYGSWQACTDSYIGVKGLQRVVNTRKNGETFDTYQTYDIGDEI